MHGSLQHKPLLSKCLNNTKPQPGLWISVFPLNSTGSLMQGFLWENHAFVCPQLLMRAVQQLDMCLAHKGVSELIRCCMQAG